MYPLPRDSLLGKLSINEVLDYYDGPKLFTAKNAVGFTYLAFWADQTDFGDIWLYAPVSNGRLQKLKSGDVSLREAFLHSEDDLVYKIFTPFSGEHSVVEFLPSSTVDSDLLPLPSDRLSVVSKAKKASKGKSEYRQELRVLRGNQSPKLSAVTAIFNSWWKLIKAIADSGDYELELYAEGARYGSFIIELSTSDAEASDFAIKRLKEFIELSDDAESLFGLLKEEDIDPSLLEDFIETVANNDCQIEITTYRDNSRSVDYYISLEKGMLSGLLPRIRGISKNFLGTDKIPQADELDRVFLLIDLASRFKQINSETMGGITDRQVSYYKHAARVLKFLDEQNCLTAAGNYVASLDNKRRLITTANQFGTSDCGWAWLSWSKVSTLSQIDKTTAANFLMDIAPGLSESTARRRAVTLKAWQQELAPYHFGSE